MFVRGLDAEGLLARVAAVQADLYGSLGATGKGHGSDKAILLGLEGETPEAVDPAAIPGRLQRIRAEANVHLLGRHVVAQVAREALDRRAFVAALPAARAKHGGPGPVVNKVDG